MSEPICGHDGLSQFYDNDAGRMRCRDCIVERACNPIDSIYVDKRSIQAEISAIAEKIQAAHAKMGGYEYTDRPLDGGLPTESIEAHEPLLVARSCKKCIASTGELLAAFRVQLDTERQRANRLGDEAGSAEARFLEMAKYRNEWEARCSDLESKARSDARTIARLKAEIAILRRFPL